MKLSSQVPNLAGTSLAGTATFTAGGQTTHPNSTFITIAQVPEDLTTVTPTNSSGSQVNLGPGNWTNNTAPYVKLSSQVPNLAGTSVTGAVSFVPSPINTITWGISYGPTAPAPGTTSGTDSSFANSQTCSTTIPVPGGPIPPALATPAEPLSLTQGDGQYLVHYFAQDCAGTQELLFANTMGDGTGSWSTNYYTFPINLDTVAPEVVSGPTLSPAPDALGNYQVGETVIATYDCTDDRSGIVSCGTHTYSTAGTLDTGALTTTVNTLSTGTKTFKVTAVDAAGNTLTSQPVSYNVAQDYDAQIQFTESPGTVTYPLGTNLTVQVASTTGHVPTGTIVITDSGTALVTLNLSGGAVYYYLKGLSAGTHVLSAVYSGDHYNVAGTSAPVVLNVQPVPVTLSASCWNTPYPYGADFHCGVYASSNAGAPLGVITYTYDGQAPVTLRLASGTVNFAIPKPPVGGHSLVIGYAAQTNYAAAGPITESFTVTPAPVIVQFTPSSWDVTKGNLTLTAAVQSSSAGAPNATGSVTFSYSGTPLSVSPITVNASGSASLTIPVTSLPDGKDVLTATYSGGTNYATGSTSITVQVAH